MWVREIRSPVGSWVHRELSVSFLKRSHGWKRWQLLWKGYKKTPQSHENVECVEGRKKLWLPLGSVPFYWLGIFSIVISSGISKATNLCNCRSWAERLFTEDLSAWLDNAGIARKNHDKTRKGGRKRICSQSPVLPLLEFTVIGV